MHLRGGWHRKGKAAHCLPVRPTTALHIPQPCPESWAAMLPTATGRHCTACAKTVVDFTLKTDAEILAYLAGAANGRTCGRFAAGQLERPLQRAAPAAPTARWRAWLAAAVALWAVRESSGMVAHAQTPSEWRARYWGGPVPAASPAGKKGAALPATAAPVSGPLTMGEPASISSVPTYSEYLAPAPVILRGIVTDFPSKEGVPGATIYLKGTTIGASTNYNGAFELTVPPELTHTANVTIIVSFVGYLTQQRLLPASAAGAPQNFCLQADVKGMLGEVILLPRPMPPAPWHPRRFYYWGKYWLTRPFRRN